MKAPPSIDKSKINVCKTLMSPFPNMWRVCWPLTLPFDLLTCISIRTIYSFRTIYLPSLKLVCKAFLSYQLLTMWETDMTFDFAPWPTDLNIKRDHLVITDYLPTKFKASGEKLSWVISCTKYWRSTLPLTLAFDLLTWKSIGIIYLSWAIYLPSLRLLGQSIVEFSVAQGMGDQHDLWSWNYWPENQ